MNLGNVQRKEMINLELLDSRTRIIIRERLEIEPVKREIQEELLNRIGPLCERESRHLSPSPRIPDSLAQINPSVIDLQQL